MPLLLGKKPARSGAVRLKFGTYFSVAELPVPPAFFGRPWLISSWGLLANDAAQDCVQAGAAHETMLWTAEATGQPTKFTDQNVLADYLAINPGDTSFSGGTDLSDAAAYRKSVGVLDANGVRHKVDAYVALKAGDLEQVALAAYLMGAVGIGVALPSSAMDQFNRAEPFSVVEDSPIEGGHYVSLCGRNSLGNFLVVTWGRLQAVTPQWLGKYMDEGLAYLSVDRLKANLSPQGFDYATLVRDLKELTA